MSDFLKKFKRYKISYYSALIFTAIFIFTLIIPLISNDKPIIIKYEDRYYFPIFKNYAETEFGGDFATIANYKDPYLQNKIKEKGYFIFPPFKYSYDTINYYLKTPPPSPPSSENILGTDDQARDVFARLIYGLRISLLFGIILTVISSVIGIIIGAASGYFGGKFDIITQRIIEIWSGLPMIFILIIMTSFIIPNFWWLIIIMILFSWVSLILPVRAEFLKARKLEYVTAARSLGVSEHKIILKHILPNALIAAITFIPFIITSSIISLTALDFLGFGMPAGSASLGELLEQGRNNPHAIWLSLTSFTTLTIILTLIIFIGEGVRDAINDKNN